MIIDYKPPICEFSGPYASDEFIESHEKIESEISEMSEELLNKFLHEMNSLFRDIKEIEDQVKEVLSYIDNSLEKIKNEIYKRANIEQQF